MTFHGGKMIDLFILDTVPLLLSGTEKAQPDYSKYNYSPLSSTAFQQNHAYPSYDV
jgi:hypothetical protein